MYLLKEGTPPKRRFLTYGLLVIWAAWIAWQLPDSSGWQFSTGLVLVVGDLALIAVMEIGYRRDRAKGSDGELTR